VSSQSRIPDAHYPTIQSYLGEEDPEETFRANLDALAQLIDWDEHAQTLANCWIDQLDEEIAEDIRRMANSPSVIALAHEQGVDKVLIVVFLLANRAHAHNNRSAMRVLSSLRKDLSPSTRKAILQLDEGQTSWGTWIRRLAGSKRGG
jgi:hypothetical protein